MALSTFTTHRQADEVAQTSVCAAVQYAQTEVCATSPKRPQVLSMPTLRYNFRPMTPMLHKSDPLLPEEWESLLRTAKAVGNATVARRMIETTGPLGAGAQTVPTDTLVGLTEGYKSILAAGGQPVKHTARTGGIVPLISKDFIMHWRDLAESRQTRRQFSVSKVAAAASCCARSEDKLALFGHTPLGYEGLMTVEGRNSLMGLQWSRPGDAFKNFTKITQLLLDRGHNGPYAAVVHPRIYADMHRVLEGSAFLEIAHVRGLLKAGVFRSSLLAPRTGVVISTGKQNLELIISIDTSVAFLGAKQMNLPFRVFKAIYLRIARPDAICTFS